MTTKGRRYEWETPRGDTVKLGQVDIDALALVLKTFPGARACRLRLPGGDWERL